MKNLKNLPPKNFEQKKFWKNFEKFLNIFFWTAAATFVGQFKMECKILMLFNGDFAHHFELTYKCCSCCSKKNVQKFFKFFFKIFWNKFLWIFFIFSTESAQGVVRSGRWTATSRWWKGRSSGLGAYADARVWRCCRRRRRRRRRTAWTSDGNRPTHHHS